MVRGSVIRATHLDDKGRVTEPAYFGVSKAVAKIQVNEVAEAASVEVIENPEEEKRLRFTRSTQTIRNTVDIQFLHVDPSVLSLLIGVPLVYGAGSSGSELGFGEFPFGMGPFGESEVVSGRVIGFDAGSRLPIKSFALEVWSKLDQESARSRPLGFDELPFDDFPFDEGAPRPGCERRWGYTLFPHLRGGRINGFKFANGLVSFNVIGAQTRRLPGWGVGPYDVDGAFQRMLTPVSRNTSYRQFITQGQPPVAFEGVQEQSDRVRNGTAANPMPDPTAPLILDGGTATDSGPYIISGGRP